MEVIAKKTGAAYAKYIILLICGALALLLIFLIVSLYLQFGEEEPYKLYMPIFYILCFSGFILPFSIIHLVDISKTPDEIITIDTNTNIITINTRNNSTQISLFDIKKISVSRAWSRYNRLKWGSVVINDTLKCKYVDDCTKVEATIYKLQSEVLRKDLMDLKKY